MGKGAKEQTVTQKLDPQTAAYTQEVFNRFRDASQQPYQATLPGAGDRLYGAAGLADRGLAALGGDPNAVAGLMNPYQQQVIGALGQSYDRARSEAALDANDAATRAGAFGGDRHALLVGERQGALDRAQQQDTANLLYQGYNNAIQQAGQGANLGLGAADFYNQLTQEQRDWMLRNARVLKEGLAGTPYGQTQTTPLYRNPLAGAAGGALTGAQIGSLVPGVGTAAGAIAGGLIGLF